MGKQKWKRALLNMGTFLLLLFLIFSVFHKDWRAIMDCLGNISAAGLVLLLGMGMGYQMLESAACYALVRGRKADFRYGQAVALIYLEVFGNVATSAAATIPMQSCYLYGQGVQPGSGVGMMMVEYIFHKAAVFFYAMLMLLLQGKWLSSTVPELMPYIGMGVAVCALIVIVLVMLCTWSRIQRIFLWGIGKLPDTGKWKGRKAAWRRNLEALYAESRDIFRSRGCCRGAALLHMLKQSWLYLIPFVCMAVLDIPGPSPGRIQLLASIMLVIVGALPNLAGIGPAEFAFLLIFTPYIGKAPAFSVLILYRVATYFFPFLISVGVFLKIRRRYFSPAGGK